MYGITKRGIRRWLLIGAILTGAPLCAPTIGQRLPTNLPLERQARPMPSPLAPTSEIVVFLKPGTDATRFARENGLQVQYALRSDPNAYVFRTASPQRATLARTRLTAHPLVREVYPNRRTSLRPFSFVADDPYFHRDTPAPGWPGQWHLVNEYTPGLDARVLGAWNRDITGQGVTIGIVDDGIEIAHPDLAPNYVAADSWDFGDNDPIPNPRDFVWYDVHGTAVAGVAAARGGNSIGGSGAAPLAGLAGLRLGFDNQTDAMVADATLYHSSGDNRSIKVKNHSYGNWFDYLPNPAQTAALATSTAAGTIHCFAAGNGRDGSYSALVEDSNRLSPQNSPDSITVGAMGSSGQYALYSNYGANISVVAPSSSHRVLSGYPYFELDVTTTDRMGEAGYNWGTGGRPDAFPDASYTSVFGGTSSATPLVAGVMALGKQAQPNLNTRFAKHLLAITSDIVDPNDATIAGDGDGVTPGSAWKRNTAGFYFNQNYGFGLINADAFTRLATQYNGVTPLEVEETGLLNVREVIPDDGVTPVRRTFFLNATTPLEEVVVTLNVTHPWRGDIEAYLVSPSGTRARIVRTYNPWYDVYGYENDIHWTFCVNTFWGENPRGNWTLEVLDRRGTNVGTLDSFAITARMGTLISGQNARVLVSNLIGGLGQAVTLRATLQRISDGVGLSGGTLTFKVKGNVVGTAITNANGVATCRYTIPSSLRGQNPVTVEFAGTVLYRAASGNGTLTIVKANTSVTPVAVTGTVGSTVVLKATLRRTTDSAVLYGGNLLFRIDGTIMGAAVTNQYGVAQFHYVLPTSLSRGIHTLTVSFAGTTLYKASSGKSVVTVN